MLIGVLGLVVVWFLVDEFYLEPMEVPEPAPVVAITEPSAGAPGAQESGQDAEAPAPAPVSLVQQSVAVLPFRAMSSGQDDEYFADGLTEEILNSLSQLPELLVTARTSSFHFKGQDLPVPEIAAALGVEHVVEGSVRRAGEQVRITAQLIRAADGFHLWSQTYDRTLENVFAVQEDIARSIAETLDVVLDEQKLQRMRDIGIGNVEAFVAYQKGVESFNAAHEDLANVTSRLTEEAVPLFNQALELAPNLVAARVLKADAAGHVVFEIAAGEREPAYEGEGEDALNALREEYELAWKESPPGRQRDMLNVERGIFEDDWSGLAARLDRAFEPGGCITMNWGGELASAMGRKQQVLTKRLEQKRCDPLNPLIAVRLIIAQLESGDAEDALASLQAAIDEGNNFGWLEDTEVGIRLALGDLDHPAVQATGQGSAWIQFPRELLLQARLGNAQGARAIAEELERSGKASDMTGLITFAIVGDRQRANDYAALIDARPGGTLVLVNSIVSCGCGAPFDLEATPNFRARLTEAGFPWPPEAVISYPTKEW
jgi:TolB-like protein